MHEHPTLEDTATEPTSGKNKTKDGLPRKTHSLKKENRSSEIGSSSFLRARPVRGTPRQVKTDICIDLLDRKPLSTPQTQNSSFKQISSRAQGDVGNSGSVGSVVKAAAPIAEVVVSMPSRCCSEKVGEDAAAM